MAEYKVEVTTGDRKAAGTRDHISITLYGREGESEQTQLDNFGRDFLTGKTGTYTVKSSSSLGELLLLKVEKDPCSWFPEDEWYCSTIKVITPEGDAILFPCHRWISTGEYVELRGGRATKAYEDDHPLSVEHRQKELSLKKELYRWKPFGGLPHMNAFEDGSEMPAEIRFSKSRQKERQQVEASIGIELKLKGLLGSKEKWENIDEMKDIFMFKKTEMSVYVTEHWKEDDFFGYQFLNGINPTMIKRCTAIPQNFAVTEAMVQPFLAEGTCLRTEMQKGNIFLYDQKKMDGIPPTVYQGQRLTVAAGLCLFYLNQENKLMPIAIQLQQQPGEQNPVFLPSDSESDWLLAKMYIRNADMMDHESVHHLMYTHFMEEVYALATLRCFPVIHPLYKLLIPHFKYTINVNFEGLPVLMGPQGIFSMSSLGNEGMTELMTRSLPEMTYSSGCLPENIASRGLESIPNYYYRDDGLRLWGIIESFVTAVVEHYYPSDSDVCRDSELQEWIREIFNYGLLGNKASGFPSCFDCSKELIHFLTMVIFNASAQHAAVNNGQFDYNFWMPNASLMLLTAPPTTKGQSSMETILEALPDVGLTVKFASLLYLLSYNYNDDVPLGQYPDVRFDEPAVTQMIKEFQAELSYLGEEISQRNAGLEVPYTYLHPESIDNSVNI